MLWLFGRSMLPLSSGWLNLVQVDADMIGRRNCYLYVYIYIYIYIYICIYRRDARILIYQSYGHLTCWNKFIILHSIWTQETIISAKLTVKAWDLMEYIKSVEISFWHFQHLAHFYWLLHIIALDKCCEIILLLYVHALNLIWSG